LLKEPGTDGFIKCGASFKRDACWFCNLIVAGRIAMRSFNEWGWSGKKIPVGLIIMWLSLMLYAIALPRICEQKLFCFWPLSESWPIAAAFLGAMLINAAFVITLSIHKYKASSPESWLCRLVAFFFPPIVVTDEMIISSKECRLIIIFTVLSIFSPVIFEIVSSGKFQLFSFPIVKQSPPVVRYSALFYLAAWWNLALHLPLALLALGLHLKVNKLLISKEGKISSYTFYLAGLSAFLLLLGLFMIFMQH